MKKIILFICLVSGLSSLTAGVLVVEGKFQNKNIFVRNFFGANGIGFCATEIKVNGHITTDDVNSSSFEIDLAAMNIKQGQKVIIEIVHKSDCMPVVLNPEDLRSRPTFELVSMTISAEGVFKWSAKNETGSLPYVVEQFKWNKWIPVGEVQGIGTPDNHDYSFKVETHSGENKFRVKQVGFGVSAKTSAPVILNSLKDKLTYAVSKDGKAIQFSAPTAFELFDAYGNIVKKGFDNQINMEKLPKSKYYFYYDNQGAEFEKKK